MADIFISYKREDQEQARNLADALERQGWSVWWDPKLRAGEHFDDVIDTALREANCVVVIWSQRSVKSRYVKDEATYALKRNKLVPMAIEEVELPFRFEGIHTPQLIHWDKSESNPILQNIVSDIAGILGQSPVVVVDEQRRLAKEAERDRLREPAQLKAEEEKARKTKEERARKAEEEKARKTKEERARKTEEEKARKTKEERARKAEEEKAEKEVTSEDEIPWGFILIFSATCAGLSGYLVSQYLTDSWWGIAPVTMVSGIGGFFIGAFSAAFFCGHSAKVYFVSILCVGLSGYLAFQLTELWWSTALIAIVSGMVGMFIATLFDSAAE